jgi:hypothetical protein
MIIGGGNGGKERKKWGKREEKDVQIKQRMEIRETDVTLLNTSETPRRSSRIPTRQIMYKEPNDVSNNVHVHGISKEEQTPVRSRIPTR